MSEKDFLSFLVDETLRLQKRGEVDLSSLELKLKDYGIEFFRGFFIPQSQTLRFTTPIGSLDIPINWSIFSIDGIRGGYTLLDRENDQDSFFAIMKKAWNRPVEKLLVTHADGFCYIVGLKKGDDLHLHDLLRQQEWLKAA